MKDSRSKQTDRYVEQIEFVVCGQCGCHVRVGRLGDFEEEGVGTAGYTDGRSEGQPAYLYVEDPLVVRCQRCQAALLVSAHQILMTPEVLSWRETFAFLFFDKLPAPPVDESAHLEILQVGSPSTLAETNDIRQQLLRYSNDRIRHLSDELKTPLASRGDELVRQIRLLAETIDRSTPLNVAICVEAFRELGQFELALKTYEQYWKFPDDEALECGIETIRSRCLIQDPLVCKFTDFSEEIDY